MAKVRVAAYVLAESLFGYSEHPVEIMGCQIEHDGTFVFSVVGPDVPECEQAMALCSLQTNRAGQRFVTMTFEPIQ